MLKKALEIFLSLLLTILICIFLQIAYSANALNARDFMPAYVPFVLGVIIGLIFYLLLSPVITRYILKKVSLVEEKLVNMSLKELLLSVFGALIGLAIANLIGISFSGYGPLGTVLIILLNIILGYLGFRVAQKKKDEITDTSGFGGFKFMQKQSQSYGRPKILDTSVIIDGRILDILQTGFVEGKIIIPNFVLEELRHIADSADGLKRNRGRRGLDILNEIQKQSSVMVEIVDFNTKEQLEVDSKLLKMGEKLDAFVVTNDFNLNKVAEFQGVRVLNINELANAIKPVVLPGEEMNVTVIKIGKENSQGIAYLNDGTMIVVEGGNKYIGENLDVIVTSVLQTSAGRMIFTKVKQ